MPRKDSMSDRVVQWFSANQEEITGDSMGTEQGKEQDII
jgi:hypothetical protein